MTTYGISLDDENSSLKIILNPARAGGDRVGIVISDVTYWMRGQQALELQRELAQHKGKPDADVSTGDLSSYGITKPVSSADIKALSRFLSKVRPILEMDASAG
jgi:hypothetical protein